MNPIESETNQARSAVPLRAPSPAPLIAAIEREIGERCAALQELEAAWLGALLARDFTLAAWIVDCSRVHRGQLALARAELRRSGGPAADADP